MLSWIFAEKRRRDLLLLVVGMVVLAIVVAVVTVRGTQGKAKWDEFQAAGGIGAGLGSASTTTPGDHAHDDLDRPDGREVAVEVVQAWLNGDDVALAEVSNPNVVVMLAGRPAPAGLTIDAAALSVDGDTYQSWSVALSDGTHAEVSLSWAAVGDARWTASTVIVGA